MSGPHPRSVVVTGLGVVAPNGIGKKEFWQGLMNSRNGIGRISRFDSERYASQAGAEVKNFQPHPKIHKEHLTGMDRAYQFAATAALEAVEDAALDLSKEDTGRAGVYMGVGVGGVDSTEKEFHVLQEQGFAALSPHLYQTWLPSACSGYISLLLGLHGGSHVLSTGCTSSVDAIGAAMGAIRFGEEDIAIAGGAEAPLTPLTFNSFCAMRALSTRNDDPAHASRPFDRERDGFVLGEGAGVLVLESFEHARRRGAKIYAEIAGYGTTSNAFHMTAPEPAGTQAVRAFHLALRDASISEEAVDYICAHGSSTPLNEKAETLAIKRVFGSRSYHIPVSSIKSMIGHTLGSAGALQAVTCALALSQGAVPPTINYEIPDPDCDLDIVPNVARDFKTRVVMTNTAGFSGKNSVTVMQAV
jgi:3-oxoacyl-[acyl-carrier-protein] synthase II